MLEGVGHAEIAMQGVGKLQGTFSHMLLFKPFSPVLSHGEIAQLKLLLPPRLNHWGYILVEVLFSLFYPVQIKDL